MAARQSRTLARRQRSVAPPTRRASIWKYWLVWASTFLGGAFAGVGVFLVVQVQLLEDIRAHVREFSGLKRWLGNLTFLWRDFGQKLGLVLDEIPNEVLDHSRTAGWTLFWIGGVGFAFLVPTVLGLNWKLRR